MNLNTQKNEIQNQAVTKWLESNKKGTCEIITGFGKTFIALHCLYTMPKDNKIHLFLAETTQREKDLLDDIKKYNKFFNRNVLKDYTLHFYCYQTVYKWKNREIGLVIADEIHDSLTPSYSAFYRNNKYDAILGLSATINRKTKYENLNITKGTLIDKIAPVCYTYNIAQGRKDGTSRELKIYVINHELDNRVKSVLSGSKTKQFYQTEHAAYTYWDKEHKKSWFIEDQQIKDLKIRITSTKRSKILYDLKSKIPVVKTILENVKGKTILFGNSIDSLLQVTPNVLNARNSKGQNDLIREAFEKNKIRTIGSFKMLKQGANLSDLDNCIIMSYYSTEKDIIQRIGRLRNNGTTGYIFILLTNSTQEEVWFSKMFENMEDMDITYCPNINYCIKNYLHDYTKTK